MIKIELGMSVVTKKQIEEVAKALGMDEKETYRIAYMMERGVATNDEHGFEVGEIVPFQYKDKDGETQLSNLDTENFAYGADALKYLCDTKTDYILRPVSAVDIPADVYYECSGTQWCDISSLAARVENRSKRFSRLMALDPPMILLHNEYRMLQNAVEMLEANDCGPEPQRWDSGRVKRALNDIGFSLAFGWRQEMLDYFEKRDQAYDAAEDFADADEEEAAEEEGNANG